MKKTVENATKNVVKKTAGKQSDAMMQDMIEKYAKYLNVAKKSKKNGKLYALESLSKKLKQLPMVINWLLSGSL